MPDGLSLEDLGPQTVAPNRDTVVALGQSTELQADIPNPPLDGTDLAPIAVQFTVVRDGKQILRQAGDAFLYENWTPARVGRFVFTAKALYSSASLGGCEVSESHSITVIRRVVSPKVLLKRIQSMLIRMQKGVQREDFGAAARTLDSRLLELRGLRFRSVPATRALDRWISSTGRFQRLLERLDARREEGLLDESDLAATQREVAIWTRATNRFLAELDRAFRQ